PLNSTRRGLAGGNDRDSGRPRCFNLKEHSQGDLDMARGNSILVSTGWDNTPLQEGIIAAGETPSPGMILQKQSATALVGGRHTYEIFNADADGGNPKGPFYLLLEDKYQGKTTADAY